MDPLKNGCHFDLCESMRRVLISMSVTLESTVLPFIFLASIGLAIIYNFGSNIFLGEISYLTKAIAAVLQLGVTMDYSIFLYRRYEEERENHEDKRDAMTLILWLKLNSNDLKLFTAVIVAVFLAVPYLQAQSRSSFKLAGKRGRAAEKGESRNA